MKGYGTTEASGHDLERINELANEVLHGPLLSLPPQEVMDILIQAVESSTTEAQGTIARALKEERMLSLGNHSSVLSSLSPLLTSPSMPTRTQAAQCLLRYASTASASALHEYCPNLIKVLSRSLGPLQYRTSDFATLRFVSAALRLLNSMLVKLSRLDHGDISTCVQLLSTWIYLQSGATGTLSPAPDRGRPAQSAGLLVQGALGALPTPAPSRRHARTSSQSSVHSSRSGWASESDDEAVESGRLAKGLVQVRIDALTALRSLAAIDPKQLYKHWHVFLSDSPYTLMRPSLLNLVQNDPSVSVRLRACAALETMLEGSAPYLAVAEDKPTRVSFTSLSHKIGGVVVELHLQLATVINGAASRNDHTLVLALLELAQCLAQNSPYHRILRPILNTFVPSITPCLENRPASIIGAAARALATVARNGVNSSEPVKSAVPATISGLRNVTDEAALAELWLLLAAVTPHTSEDIIAEAVEILADSFRSASTAVEAAQMAFVVSYMKTEDLSTTSTILQEAGQRLATLLTSALAGERAELRVLACSALAGPRLRRTCPSIDPLALTAIAMNNADLAVRAAAARAMGLLVKTAPAPREEELQSCAFQLASRVEECEPVGSSASWAFANCCDMMRGMLKFDVEQLLATALSLSRLDACEKSRPNGLRALGSLLRVTSTLCPTHEAEATDILIVSLSSGPVKCRWNAAAAIANALSRSSNHAPSLSSKSIHALVLAASASLSRVNCPNLKVRIQSTGAISSALANGIISRDSAGDDVKTGETIAVDAGTLDSLATVVLQRVGNARTEIESERDTVAAKEVQHLLQLIDKLEHCAERLRDLVQSPPSVSAPQ